jgi:molybdenum cofactor biosynthesis protein B
MGVEGHRALSAGAPPRYAILTVSDSRDEASDRSGAKLVELVEASGATVAGRRLVPDELGAIREAAREAIADPGVDVLLVTGGTGAAPRDVTPEAVEPLLEKPLPGFGELFRALSYEAIGPAAMLSRASAGVAGGTAVFLLPGSPAAVELATARLILPEAPHLLTQARRTD